MFIGLFNYILKFLQGLSSSTRSSLCNLDFPFLSFRIFLFSFKSNNSIFDVSSFFSSELNLYFAVVLLLREYNNIHFSIKYPN